MMSVMTVPDSPPWDWASRPVPARACVVGVGGSVQADSQSERALRAVLAAAASRGMSTRTFIGDDIALPPYRPGAALPHNAADLLDAVRTADAVVIASPGYHGTVSGLVKNALDYFEELREDRRPYLQGRAVGVIAVASTSDAAVATLGTLRQVTHALRGWPTPLGLAVNSQQATFDEACMCTDLKAARTIELMGEMLAEFAANRTYG